MTLRRAPNLSTISPDRAALIACPWCGTAVNLSGAVDADGGGESCGRAYAYRGSVLHWDNATSGRARLQRSARSLLRTQINPLTSRLSPLRYFSDWRIESYYRRALHNAALSRRWADHYLHDLDVRAGSRVLDYGCGRGRNVALLSQLGFRVYAQDIQAHAWWTEVPDCTFQVVPPDAPRLPWASAGFALTLDVSVAHYLNEQQLSGLVNEVFRVLRPGGYWIVVEANHRSYGARMPRSFTTRLHTLESVQALVDEAGFSTVDVQYEGFYAPIAPRLVNFVRQQCWPGPLDIADYGSRLEAMTPASRRALWVLRLRKPQL